MPPACRVLRSVCGHVVASAGASADVETQVETELIVRAVSGTLDVAPTLCAQQISRARQPAACTLVAALLLPLIAL